MEWTYHECRRCGATIEWEEGQQWPGDNVGCPNEYEETPQGYGQGGRRWN